MQPNIDTVKDISKLKFSIFINILALILAVLNPDSYFIYMDRRIRFFIDMDPDAGNPMQYGSGSRMPIQYGSAWIRIRDTVYN